MTRWPAQWKERAMVRPFDIPRPVTRIVLRWKVEELVRRWRLEVRFWVVGCRGERRVLRMVSRVTRGVKRRARRIREKFWRR